MAINFPNSPSDGDTHQGFTYNSTKNKWSKVGGGGGSSVTVSDSAPSSPNDGDMWYNSLDLNLYVYYNDASSSQWVQSAPLQVGADGAAGADGSDGATGPQGPAGSDGTSVTAYANLAAFPSSGNTVGDFGFANDTKAVYIWDGTEWDRINAGPDALPDFTTDPSSSYTLASDGATTTTITTAASDPEGFPITWDYDTNPSNQSQATVTNNNDGTFVLTPSGNSSDAGTFTFRVKASDGVHMSTRSSSVELSFGVGDVYGFSITQTSGTYTSFTIAAIGTMENGTTGNIWDDANFRNTTTFSSAAWGSGFLDRDHTFDGNFFATQANTSYGVTLPNPFKAGYWSMGAVNQTVTVTWTSPKTIKGVMASGQASNGNTYWTGGYLQLYIGSASNLVATQYPLAGVNAFHNFMV